MYTIVYVEGGCFCEMIGGGCERMGGVDEF